MGEFSLFPASDASGEDDVDDWRWLEEAADDMEFLEWPRRSLKNEINLRLDVVLHLEGSGGGRGDVSSLAAFGGGSGGGCVCWLPPYGCPY